MKQFIANAWHQRKILARLFSQKHLLFIFLAIIAIGISKTASSVKILDVKFGDNKPPFLYIENGNLVGIEIDIIREIFNNLGYSIRSQLVSNQKLEHSIQEGADVAASIYPINPKGYYSDNFIIYDNYIITLKSRNLKINSIKDLHTLTIASWQNAWQDLGDEFNRMYNPETTDQSGVIPLIEFSDQMAQNRFFWMGRADALLCDKTIFLWAKNFLIKEGKIPIAAESEIVYHKMFEKYTGFKVEFKDKNLRDKFNAELKRLRRTGKYDRIVANAIKQ